MCLAHSHLRERDCPEWSRSDKWEARNGQRSGSCLAGMILPSCLGYGRCRLGAGGSHPEADTGVLGGMGVSVVVFSPVADNGVEAGRN